MTYPTARTATWPALVSLTLTLALMGSALGGALTATSASAADDPTDRGLWYYSGPQFDTVHKTTTGKGITIAVLDSPINPAAPDLAGVKNLITRPDSFCKDETGALAPATGTTKIAEHATDMVSLIIGTGVGAGGNPGTLGVAPGATVHHYAVATATEGWPCGPGNPSGIAAGIDQAVTGHAQIISMSFGGDRDPAVLDAIGRAERAGVIVVVASKHNGGTELGWPASANGVVAVEADDANGQLNKDAVTSPLLGVVSPGETIRAVSWSEGQWNTYNLASGSSEATAWTSGVLALVWSAHPDANANQIIQTLLRNTVTGKGQLIRDDSWGYGPVTVKATLAADPGTYPDVNPLLRKDADAQPAYADIVGPATTAGAGTKPGTTTGLPVALIVGAGLLVLVILAAIVLAVVLTRRNRTRTPPVPQYQPVR